MYILINVCAYLHMYIFTCMYTYIYIYICTYTHTHTYTHVYITLCGATSTARQLLETAARSVAGHVGHRLLRNGLRAFAMAAGIEL